LKKPGKRDRSIARYKRGPTVRKTSGHIWWRGNKEVPHWMGEAKDALKCGWLKEATISKRQRFLGIQKDAGAGEAIMRRHKNLQRGLMKEEKIISGKARAMNLFGVVEQQRLPSSRN